MTSHGTNFLFGGARVALGARSRGHADLVAKSYDLIPGGTTTSAQPVAGLEFLVERGKGAYIYDVDGRPYLDFFMGSGPLVLGHAHPRMIDAITRAAANGTHHLGMHRRTLELTERIIRYVPCAEQVRYTSSGSEATMHALRLARAATGRQRIVKFDGAYHGHHDLVCWNISNDSRPLPEPSPESAGTESSVQDHVSILAFNDAAAFRDFMKEHGRTIAAVICEPLQRALPPVPGFLQTLREECDRHGTILIFDEVVTGLRLAPGGAQERYGVTPDIASIGKALSGGLPYAAIAGKRALMSHFDPKSDHDHYSYHCGTFSGYYLGAECAHAVLDVLIDEGGIDHLNRIGQQCRERLRRLFRDRGIPAFVAGDGAIYEVYFTTEEVTDQAAVRRSNHALARAFHRKLLEGGVYKSSVKAYLGTCHGEAEIEQLVDIAGWALSQLQK